MIRELIHKADPYAALPKQQYNNWGWHSDSPYFEQIIFEVRPLRILEIGSWLGASAIHMANICKALGLQTEIVCVDTWLGALEFWTNQDDTSRYEMLRLQDGYPSVYEQFRSNVIRSGLAGMITPFPITSDIAFRFFEEKGIKFDLIYIDGSHDYSDVKRDVHNACDTGAVVFGDDFDQESVSLATMLYGAKPTEHPPMWRIP
jgi:hypothetical protein